MPRGAATPHLRYRCLLARAVLPGQRDQPAEVTTNRPAPLRATMGREVPHRERTGAPPAPRSETSSAKFNRAPSMSTSSRSLQRTLVGLAHACRSPIDPPTCSPRREAPDQAHEAVDMSSPASSACSTLTARSSRHQRGPTKRSRNQPPRCPLARPWSKPARALSSTCAEHALTWPSTVSVPSIASMGDPRHGRSRSRAKSAGSRAAGLLGGPCLVPSQATSDTRQDHQRSHLVEALRVHQHASSTLVSS